MDAMMKTFRFTDISNGLELRDIPIPTPGKGQVLVQVKATGLCHTDCNVLSGKDDMLVWKRPITLGHEIAGIIVGLGLDVNGFSIGERVVSGVGTSHPLTIEDMTTSAGIGYDGGYAEFAVFYTAKTLRIPDGVTFAHAAMATDAVATAYHAVVAEGQATSSSTIAIVGLGGLGLSGVNIASFMGTKVYGVDVNPKKYPVALHSGALTCAKSLEYFSGIRFDTVVDFAGAGFTTAAAVKALKSGGRIVLVGLAAKEATLSTYDFVAQGVTLKGSAGSSLNEVETVLGLIAKGKIVPPTEEISFANIPDGLDRLVKGDVLGRLYADPSNF